MKEKNTSLEILLMEYSAALQSLETQLDILLKDFTYKNHYNPVEHVKSRIKSYDSIVKKLTSRGYDVTTRNIKEHVHDMVGIRIVCSFLPDVYKIVEMIEQCDQITIHNRKDYIANPKETGYSSYHLLVYVPVYLMDGVTLVEAEIQIRTMAMDFWASLDHKIGYKFQGQIPKEISDNLYKCALDINDLDHKMLILNDKMKSIKEDKEIL